MANILIDGNSYIKLCDFGLAIKLEPGVTDKSCCGTPTTWAPEVI